MRIALEHRRYVLPKGQVLRMTYTIGKGVRENYGIEVFPLSFANPAPGESSFSFHCRCVLLDAPDGNPACYHYREGACNSWPRYSPRRSAWPRLVEDLGGVP